MYRFARLIVQIAPLACFAACRQVDTPVPLDVAWEQGGIVRLSDGTRVVRVSVTQDIPGCLGETFDPVTDERLGSGEGEGRILDVTEIQGSRFVLASAVTAPNCNVQGHCGTADPNVTLIWLQLAPDLALATKQAFAVQDCIAHRNVKGVHDDWQGRLRLTDDALRIGYSELVVQPDTDELVEVHGRVSYDRGNASAGLQIVSATEP